MKILIAVKRVIDPYVRVRVKSDGTGVETQNIKMSMNPFDEIALEEAIRLRERGVASEIVVVTVGDNTCQDTLRHGLALGADRAILVNTDKTQLCSLNIAKILKAIVLRENSELVLMGKQTIDNDSNQTPQMLAGILDWPQATFASKIQIVDNFAIVDREIDAGIEEVKVHFPAVISVDLRLNQPRYASLPNIMKAKQKPLQIVTVEELGVDLKNHKQILEVRAPSERKKGEMVDSITSLVDKLQHEAKII